MQWLVRKTRAGSVARHDYAPDTGYRPAFTWQVYGANAVALLRMLMPHLIVKRDKAREAIRTQST